jgi:hypothetical protein
MNSKLPHVIIRWNPFYNEHDKFEYRTIEVHCEVLKKFSGYQRYVWFGKISKSGNLGYDQQDVKCINQLIASGAELHFYMYCPEKDSLHVGKLEGITIENQRDDDHTPAYYSEVPYKIPMWFKLSEIKKLDLFPFMQSHILREEDGSPFDPVSTEKYYPRKVFEETPQAFFGHQNSFNQKSKTLTIPTPIEDSEEAKEKSLTETKIKILFLAASPKTADRLRLEQEARDIEEKIRLAQKQKDMVFVNKSAVRVGDLQFYLNEEKPTIVHFSCHGTVGGSIILEDKDGNAVQIPKEALARVFNVLKDNIRCVVLNACYSLEQAAAISQYIDCVIGMSSEISDDAAIAFASAFYLAIAEGRSLKNAFDQGINELMLWSIPEEDIPKLIPKPDLDLDKIILLKEKV